MKTPSSSRGDLLEAAWEVARNRRGYGQYKSDLAALRALARRRPGFKRQQYEKAFTKAVALYDTSVAVVAERIVALLPQVNSAGGKLPDVTNEIKEVRQRCPGFRLETYRLAIAWALYWFYLR